MTRTCATSTSNPRLPLPPSLLYERATGGPAGVAELVDAPGLGPGIERCGGSSPFARTSFARTRFSQSRYFRDEGTNPDHADCRDVERRPEARLSDHHR